MGADRYSVCPKCTHLENQSIEAEERAVNDAYGKVPIENFEQMRANLAAHKASEMPATFREDWEIGSPESDGQLDLHYTGSCGECGLNFKLEKVSWPVWTPEADDA